MLGSAPSLSLNIVFSGNKDEIQLREEKVTIRLFKIYFQIFLGKISSKIIIMSLFDKI